MESNERERETEQGGEKRERPGGERELVSTERLTVVSALRLVDSSAASCAPLPVR